MFSVGMDVDTRAYCDTKVNVDNEVKFFLEYSLLTILEHAFKVIFLYEALGTTSRNLLFGVTESW